MSKEKQIEEMMNFLYNPHLIPIYGDCEDVVNALYDAGYRKQSEWISVEEKLPETRETILYFNGEWVDACYFDGDNFMTLDTYESSIVDDVTHWMPLPEPPKMKGE